MSETPLELFQRTQRALDEMGRKLDAFFAAYGSGNFDPAELIAQLQAEIDRAKADLCKELEALDISELERRFEQLEIERKLRGLFIKNHKFILETFVKNGPTTVADFYEMAVREGIAGDDSLDVADPGRVEYGKSYFLIDGVNAEEVTLLSRHEKGRIRLKSPLLHTYRENARLVRTNIVWAVGGKAIQGPGCYTSTLLSFERDGDGYICFSGRPPKLETWKFGPGKENFVEVATERNPLNGARDFLKFAIPASQEEAKAGGMGYLYRLIIPADCEIEYIAWVEIDAGLVAENGLATELLRLSNRVTRDEISKILEGKACEHREMVDLAAEVLHLSNRLTKDEIMKTLEGKA